MADQSIHDRIEQLVREAVRARRFNSLRDFAVKAGLSSSYFAERKHKIRRGKDPEITLSTVQRVAELLGVSVVDVIDPGREEPALPVDKYEGRARAIAAARMLGLPEAAIQLVLREDPGRDPGVMYWYRRIESESERVRPAAQI